jgi:hypothetical protein
VRSVPLSAVGSWPRWPFKILELSFDRGRGCGRGQPV